MSRGRWNPFLPACAAAVFGSALYFRQWLKQKQEPLSLIYDERLEKASNFNLGSYYDMVEKKLIEISTRNLKLQKFVLNTSYSDIFELQVTRLIRYAINSSVQELDLSFWYDYGPDVEIMFDASFFLSSHLTHLILSCDFPKPAHTICWENLMSLSLSNFSLTEDFFQKILSGSPVLETFKIDNCYGNFWDLNITSNSVKIFEISGNRKFRVGDPCVMLKAPNIISLTLKGSLVLSQVQVFNVTSLVEANIDYYNEDDTGGDLSVEEEEEVIYRHVKILRRACGNGLKLGDICLEVLSRLEAKGSCTDDYYKEIYNGYIEDWRMSRMGIDDDAVMIAY